MLQPLGHTPPHVQRNSPIGMGVVLSPAGEVIADSHVALGRSALRATDLGNGKVYTAVVFGYDPTTDMAVLQLVGAQDLAAAPLTAPPARIGERLAALGLGGKGGTTPGAVAATVTGVDQSTVAQERAGPSLPLAGLIQTGTAQPSTGAGAPLVASTGAVVGISVTSGPGYSLGQATQGGWAVPVTAVESIAAAIEDAGATPPVVLSRQLGASLTTSTSPTGGAEVAQAQAGSAAAMAGLGRGDVVGTLDGHPISSASGLVALLAQYGPGATVSLTWRTASGATRTAAVTLSAPEALW